MPCALPARWAGERIIVDVMGDEPPGHRSRPAAALAVLVAVTATVGGVIAILQRPPTHAPIRPTQVPTSIPTLTPTATEAPPDLSGTWTGLWSSGTSNGFCTLTLTKTGNGLDGTFILSPPADILLHVKGNLIGSTITLRSASGVVFTGTLSGSTLSGAYISNGKMYSWSVTLAA